MQVQETARRQVEQRARDELAVVGENDQVGSDCPQLFDGFGPAYAHRLQNRKFELARPSRDRSRRQDRLPPDRSIGRGNDRLDSNARHSEKRIKNGDGEAAATEEDRPNR
jgi:hypothetical protein